MTRDDFENLLVFKANGTLEGEELAALEAALASDAELRAELYALEAIRDTMQSDPVQSPGELGLARLMRDVENETRVTEAPAAANDNVVPITRLRFWQAAAAVVLAVGIGFNLTDFGPGASVETSVAFEDRIAEPAGFGLASGGSSDFTVAFAPDATEAEIRGLLLDAGVEIVSGPSALGLYGLALLDMDAERSARDILASSGIIDDLQ